MGNDPGDSPAEELDGPHSLTYRAGITLDLPIDRRCRSATPTAGRSSAFTARQRTLTAPGDRITADVRDALRAIRAAEMELEIQRQRHRTRPKTPSSSPTSCLSRALINARDAVEAQNSLLDAQDGYEQARSQLQVRVLEFMRDTGTLRVDPGAGTLGRAMDRKPIQAAVSEFNLQQTAARAIVDRQEAASRM